MASLQSDVAAAIGQQVEQMILHAKKDSEARVRYDLAVTRSQLQHMEGLIVELRERVARCTNTNGAGNHDSVPTVDWTFLSQKIAQLEQKWGAEVKALKQSLHRTILAHNHNSDLMRHHRDALDEARKRLDAQTQPRAEQVEAQIEKVDRLLRTGQTKQRAIDGLAERLGALEQQVDQLLPSPLPASYPGMMSAMERMNANVALAMAKRAPAGKKDALEPPTDEEVRARLLQLARGPQEESFAESMQFNAEAPVFVPYGTATAAAPSTLEEGPAGAPGLEPPTGGGSDEGGDSAGEAEEGVLG